MPKFYLPEKADVFALFDDEAKRLNQERKALAKDDEKGHAILDGKFSQNGYLRQRLFDALVTESGETAAVRMHRMSELSPEDFDRERESA